MRLNSVLQFVCVVFLGSFFSMTASAQDANSRRYDQGRPFRAMFLEMSPTYDEVKPLAVSDPGGWILQGDSLIGSVNSKWLTSRSLNSGSTQWFHELDGDLTAPVASIGGWVIIATRSGRVEKIDVATGKRVWELSLESFVNRGFALSGATLVAVTAGQVIYGIDFQSGKKVWLYDAGFPENLVVRTSAPPVIHNQEAIVGLSNGEVISLSLDQGKQLWRTNPGFVENRFHDVVGELAITGNKLLLTNYDGLVTMIDLNTTDKRNVWKENFPSISTSTFRNERLIVGTVGGDVIALDAMSGRQIWRTQFGQTVSTLIAGENDLYVTGSNGRIASIKLSDGTQWNWHDNLGSDISTPPILSQNLVLFATGQKSLYGYKVGPVLQ